MTKTAATPIAISAPVSTWDRGLRGGGGAGGIEVLDLDLGGQLGVDRGPRGIRRAALLLVRRHLRARVTGALTAVSR